MNTDDQLIIPQEKTAQEAPERAWEHLRPLIMRGGAAICGAAPAERVPARVREGYRRWLAEGRHAGMGYMERYLDVRDDPRLLLEGAESVISIAYNFRQPDGERGVRREEGEERLPYVASYALGSDYHDVLRERLRPVTQEIEEAYGAESRICIDSAPIHERYWAARCGIGERTANGAIHIPGIGSEVFLAEIITTLRLPDTGRRDGYEGIRQGCGNCGICRAACPGGAIGEEGVMDSRRCINYLTIEHRGDFTEEQKELLRKGGIPLFGCDRCLRACPLNRGKNPTEIEEFRMRDTFRTLTAEEIHGMEQEEFSRRFKGSPLKRAKLSGLRRNLKA